MSFIPNAIAKNYGFHHAEFQGGVLMAVFHHHRDKERTLVIPGDRLDALVEENKATGAWDLDTSAHWHTAAHLTRQRTVHVKHGNETMLIEATISQGKMTLVEREPVNLRLRNG
jgi:hypothetical protein